jgi:hypothetical protein
MAVLTDKHEALVGAIELRGMPADGACLTRAVGIQSDRHRPVQERFVGNHGMQFGERPLGEGGIGLALLLRGPLALSSFGTLSNVSQVFQAEERVRMHVHNPLTHDMIGVRFQPSLPPGDSYQSSGRRTGAFLLQTLSQSRVVVGLGNDTLARMEGLPAPDGRCHRQVADAHIYPDNAGLGVGLGVRHFHFQGDEQIELFAGLVIPEFGCPDLCAVFEKRDMLTVAGIRQHDSPGKRQDAHPALRLEPIVMPQLVLKRRGDVLRSLVQPLVPFLGHACLALRGVLLQFRPQPFVGGPDSPGDGTGHLRRYLVPGAYLVVRAILQTHLIAHLAVLIGIARDVVQRIPVGKLGLPQCLELFRRGHEFEFGGHRHLHTNKCTIFSQEVSMLRAHYSMNGGTGRGDPSAHAPNKAGPFLPRMNAGGILGRLGEALLEILAMHGVYQA